MQSQEVRRSKTAIIFMPDIRGEVKYDRSLVLIRVDVFFTVS